MNPPERHLNGLEPIPGPQNAPQLLLDGQTNVLQPVLEEHSNDPDR